MAKRLKRAFTIVELVIVIAVIAILAAVLIPTFTTLIDKANESNDIALVKNLNTALVSKEATDEVNTMQDALDAAYEYGYTVDKLTPSSSGDIVWDEVNNRFALINEKKEVVFEDGAKPLTSDKAKIWKIVTELAGTQDYSWYVGGLSKEAIEKFTFTMGVDTGSVEADVNYVTAAEQDVTIRTAGGALTVNAENATVSHYGTAVKVKITAVAKNSYHEYGEVLGNIELTKGRVVVEDGASVSTILVTSATEADADIQAEDIIIDVNNNATVGTVAATTAGVITDANTTVPSTTVIAESVTVNKDFAGGLGTEKSPYLIATAEQLITLELFGKEETTATTYNFALIDNIILDEQIDLSATNVVVELVVDMNNHKITYSASEEKQDAGYLVLAGFVSVVIDGNGQFDLDDKYFNLENDQGYSISSGYTFNLTDDSKLVIMSGSFTGGLTCVQAGDNAVCEIYGGTFVTETTWEGVNWLLNLIDNSNAQFKVYGGQFFKYDPSESHTENPVANFVAEGYKSVVISSQNDLIWYEVVEDNN